MNLFGSSSLPFTPTDTPSQRMMTFSEMLLITSKTAQGGSASIIFNSEILIYASKCQRT